MKKLLLFAAGAMMAVSASAQWAVVGSYCDWSFQKATTFSGEGEELSCEIEHFTTDFKIVDITNDNWDIQYGTATPIEIGKSYVLDGKNGGADPSNTFFAGNVIAVNNAVVKWNPTTFTLTVTGDAEEQVTDGSIIYLIGDPNGWNINDGSMTLKSISEDVYQGTFDLAAGNGIYFRFYTALGNWAGDGALPSVGPLPNDNTNVEVEFTDGVFNGTCQPGKGSWQLATWDGGDLTMKVNLKDWTVTFTVGSEDAGVESIIDANSPVEYYNLQGVKVNNPQNGIFVVKQGNKTNKVVVR